MKQASFLTAIGLSKGSEYSDYRVCFYYQIPNGGRDVTMPSWEIPCESWEQMQNTVRAFCNIVD